MTDIISSCLDNLRKSKPVILNDDIGPSSYYIISPSHDIRAEQISKLVNWGNSVICVALPENIAQDLGLPLMNPSQVKAPLEFTVSVEARSGVTTGISASDRARTVRVLATTKNPRLDIVMPGHIFPIQTKTGGVLVKSAAPEAAVDLMKMAELPAFATITHVLNKAGEFSSASDITTIADKFNLPIVKISSVIEQRLASEIIVEKISDAKLPLKVNSSLRAAVFRSKIDQTEHLALIKGNVDQRENPKLNPVVVRVQAENRLGDLFGPAIFPTREIISRAISQIGEAEAGVFLYIRHRQKKLLQNQIQTLNNPDQGYPTPSKDRQVRELGLGAQILKELGINKIKLITNKVQKLQAINAYQIEIVDTLPL